MIKLELASDHHIPTIYTLAEKIWYDHYSIIVTTEQIEYMLNKFYSTDALESQMKEGQLFYLIYIEDESPMGYIAFTEKGPGCWFMNKFYINTDLQGQGLGEEVLRQWEELIKPKELTLQVNRKNYKSINFYFKNGFKIKHVADFDIGSGFSMDDFVMEKIY